MMDLTAKKYSPRKQAAIDRTLLLRALIEKKARYEQWDKLRGEVCVGGMRHAVKVDDEGCPVLTHGLRHDLFIEVARQ